MSQKGFRVFVAKIRVVVVLSVQSFKATTTAVAIVGLSVCFCEIIRGYDDSSDDDDRNSCSLRSRRQQVAEGVAGTPPRYVGESLQDLLLLKPSEGSSGGRSTCQLPV